MKRKITGFALSTALLLQSVAICPVVSAEEEHQSVLVLGDSISYGYGLSEGDYTYGQYVADYIGASYQNLAVNGRTSAELLASLSDTQTQQLIADSEFILISAGGNDLLRPLTAYLKELTGITEFSVNAAMEYISSLSSSEQMNTLNALKKEATAWVEAEEENGNLRNTVSKIHELNPDAEIMVQTIYNPFYTTELMVEGENYASKLSLANSLCFSSVITQYNEDIIWELTDLPNVVIADTASAFLSFNTENLTKASDKPSQIYTRIRERDIHPNAFGQAVIGVTVIEAMQLNEGIDVYCEEFANILSRTDADDLKLVPSETLDKMQIYSKNYSASSLGDINADGSIDSDDAVLCLKESNANMMGEQFLLNVQIPQADVNKDGSVDSDDCSLIMQYVNAVMMGETLPF